MIFSYTKTGAGHLESGTPCQDAVYTAETAKLIFIALADGVSACENSHIGARTACRTAAQYVTGYASALAGCDDQKLAFLILEQVVFALEEQAAALGCAPESLSSTLSFCCVSKDSRFAVVFRLGDGGIYAITPEETEMLLRPAVCPGGAPASTMTRNAYKAAQIRRLDLPGDTRVLLCSDGVLKALADPALGPELKQCLSGQNFQGMKALLDQADTADDCSFIVC